MEEVATIAASLAIYQENAPCQESKVATAMEAVEVDVSATTVTNPAIFHVIAPHQRRTEAVEETAAAEAVTIAEILDIYLGIALCHANKVVEEAAAVPADKVAEEVATIAVTMDTCQETVRHLNKSQAAMEVADGSESDDDDH